MQYLCSPLASKLAYSLSEPSIHTLLDHLGVDKTPANEDTGDITLLEVASKAELDRESDPTLFGSYDTNEYILGMSESSTWNYTALGRSAEEMMSCRAWGEPVGREPVCTAADCGSDIRLDSELGDSGSYFHVEYSSKFCAADYQHM